MEDATGIRAKRVRSDRPNHNRRIPLMESDRSRFEFAVLLDRRIWIMLLLGFSAGLPLLLIFGSLSLWLREAGVERGIVTMFSWAALGYSFKFVWAPLVDQLPIPIATKVLGKRRSWLLVSQFSIVGAILFMSGIDPAGGRGALQYLAIGAVLLGFSSATQDIVIDAFRIESAEPRMQALLASTYIAGYRVAMLVSGAGVIWLAEWLGSVESNYIFSAWQTTYRLMGACMVVGVVTTLLVREPEHPGDTGQPLRDNLQLLLLFVCAVVAVILCYGLSTGTAATAKAWLTRVFGNAALAGFVVETVRLGAAISFALLVAAMLSLLKVVPWRIVRRAYFNPVREFFQRYGLKTAALVLALIGLYRISDIVLGVIANVFYYDLGFAKSEVAVVAKTFGLMMTILGGFAGGLLAYRFGVLRILLLGAILSAGTNLLFMLLASVGRSIELLYVVIAADNLSAGLAGTAFVAFLSALTNVRFTAVQYAIFSSLMTFLPKIIGGYSGAMVDNMDYSGFFLTTALLGIPVIFLILGAMRMLTLRQPGA